MTEQRIVIAGYYGYGNAGDELILACMLRGFRAQNPDLDFTVLSGDPAGTQSRHGVDSASWEDFPGIVQAIRASNLCVLGGGGLIHDYWSMNGEHLLIPAATGLGRYLNVTFLANMFGKPVVWYAIGIGPLFTDEAKDFVRLAASLCDRISVRDERSRNNLERLFAGDPGSVPEILVTADPVFLYESPIKRSTAIKQIRQGLDPRRPVLGVNGRYWCFDADPEGYPQEIASALDRYIRREGAQVLFIPFQSRTGTPYEDDAAIHRLVHEHMTAQAHAHLVDIDLQPDEAAQLIQGCDRCLGMRYHALLLAMLEGIPAVALAYDLKVRSMLEEAGQDPLILQPGDWRSDAIYDRLISAPGIFAAEKVAGTIHSKQALAEEEISRVCRIVEGEREARRVSPEVIAFLLQRLQAADEQQAALEEPLHDAQEIVQQRDDLLRHLEVLEGRIARLESERDDFAVHLQSTKRDLAGIRRTRGFRLLAAYWRVVNRLFPPGSRRRRTSKTLLQAAGLHQRRSLSDNLLPGAELSGSEENIRQSLADWEALISDRQPDQIMIILSATAWEKTSGQRSLNLAREWAQSGLAVLYCSWRWDRDTWHYAPVSEHGVVSIPLDIFTQNPSRYTSRYPGIEKILLMEFPHPDFFALLAHAGSRGWFTIYDLIDDWQDFHRVGQAPWYEADFETYAIGAADLVVATNEALSDKARNQGAGEVLMVPNGYRPGIEVVRQQMTLQQGDLTLGYFGHLTAAWFDWDLVLGVATRKPDWLVHLVGSTDLSRTQPLPENICLHSSQPQDNLASFAQHWDIGIIPFKDIPLSRAADTIKAYEYTSMGLPVVMTGAFPPPGAESWMKRVENVDAFIDAAEQLRDKDLGAAEIEPFLDRSTWEHRTNQLLGALNQGEQGVAWKRALFG